MRTPVRYNAAPSLEPTHLTIPAGRSEDVVELTVAVPGSTRSVPMSVREVNPDHYISRALKMHDLLTVVGHGLGAELGSGMNIRNFRSLSAQGGLTSANVAF